MHQRNELTNRLLRACFPKKVKDKTEEETYGIGTMNYYPLDTPVIEIAEDGKTAKGIWALRNTYSLLTAGGPEAYWQWAWVAADFIKEQDDRKIWHLQYLNDVHGKSGQPLHAPLRALSGAAGVCGNARIYHAGAYRENLCPPNLYGRPSLPAAPQNTGALCPF